MSAALAITAPQASADWLAQLFAEHSRRVLVAAYRITGSMADAEDVAQTVFLRIGSGDSPLVSNPGSYLYRAAINGALDLLRRRSADAAEPLETASDQPSTAAYASPEAGASASELRAHLRLALRTLSPRAAEIFTMRYLEGMTNPEIAAATGTSQAVVAVMLYQSRNRLRKCLKALQGGKR